MRIVGDPLVASLNALYLVNFLFSCSGSSPKVSATRQLKCTLHTVLYYILIFEFSYSPDFLWIPQDSNP